MRLASRATVLLFAAGWSFFAPSPGFALVVENQTGTTSAPTGTGNDPGWNNVTIGGLQALNFVYLGNGWALSAKHVGPEPNNPNQTLYFSSGPVDIIPGQNYIVPNPGGKDQPMGNELYKESDLRLVRLKSEVAGTSSIFGSNPQFTIASQALVANTPNATQPVTYIGHGRTRANGLTYWDSSWNELNFSPGYVPMASEYAYSGYKATDPNDDTKRWGTNVIADENPIFGHSDTDLRVTFRKTQGDGVTRDTVSMVTQFNANGLTNEAQAVDKDSGSAVFQKRSGQWQLIGIVNSIYTLRPETNPDPPNQPLNTAVYENLTTFADLSFYNSTMQSIFDAHPNYSVIGDLDLDGNFQNDLTDDLGAFVAGWGNVDPLGKATYASWAKGDVAHPLGVGTCNVSLGNGVCAGGDGKTDVYDFIAIRDELNNPAAGAALAVMLGIGGSSSDVPEPTAMALAILGAVFVGLSGRSRRRSRPQ